MKCFDANFLSLFLVDGAKAPLDQNTGEPVERVQQRIQELVRVLSNSKENIIIPTPALSEFLVLAGDGGPEYMGVLSSSSAFQIAPFDELAAVETAALTLNAIATGDKRHGSPDTWAKVKFDRQIVAIAKVSGADTIYSTDRNVRNFGELAGLRVESVSDLPEPPPEQIGINYDPEEQGESVTQPEPVGIPGSGDGAY